MDSLNDIITSTKSIIDDEVRFYSLKGIEKSSIMLGFIATVFILSSIVLIILVFATIALVHYLNSLFASEIIGYLIIAGLYLLLLILLLLIISAKKTPLLTNLFVQKFISIFNISKDEGNKSENA